ncbi:MAG: hypothetical protein JWO87_714 [Phycisphaerales bacterium]|jgi:hypothetical protein|nr:hypothetical protein [Phycisphaerales bacterium]
MRSVHGSLCLAVMGAAMSSVACESSSTRDGSVTRTRTPTGDVVVDHNPDRNIDDRADTVRGNIARDIPARAQEVRTVSGRDSVTYRPDRNGTLYVYDTDDNRLIWSGRVERDQRFTLDPAANNVSLDGQRVVDRSMSPRHSYRLYFDDTSR